MVSTLRRRRNSNSRENDRGSGRGSGRDRGRGGGNRLPAVEPQTLREQAIALVEGGSVGGVMMIMTLFALFGPDLQQLSFPKSADPIFEVLYTLTFFLFLMELLALAILKPAYFPRPQCSKLNTWGGLKAYIFALFDPSGPAFYFWLDLIACLSLILEISWMLPDPDNEETYSTTSNAQGGAADQLNTARASRVSRVGARAGRIVRIVRMVRLVRIVKIYKLVAKEARVVEVEVELETPDDRLNEGERRMKREAEERRRKKLEEEKKKREGNDPSIEDAMRTTSVGQDLSDRTTKTVILGVLVMLVAIPLISYDGIDGSRVFGGDMVHFYGVANWSSGTSALVAGINVSTNYLYSQEDIVKLTLGMPPTGITTMRYEESKIDSLRHVELLKIRLLEEGGVSDGYTTEVWYSLEEEVEGLAAWGIGLTFFVMVLLCVGAMMFSYDADRLVLHPIQNMVDVVQEIGRNPLRSFPDDEDDESEDEVMETTLLLRTIKKIGGLLRVGFGEAGAAIIAENLNKSAELDPLLPGKNVWAVFGFCDIRNFTDTTECLKEEVMGFVNRIADIVHATVAAYGGAANKNVGDAFLLTWKLKQSVASANVSAAKSGAGGGRGGRRRRRGRERKLGKIGMAVSATQRLEQSRLAQQALLSFIRVVHSISERNSEICQFSDEHAKELFARMPNYKVKLGFGLHVGWAIEGAIGSDKKIDASYLSPNVNMSETLEGTTKVYGCSLLMSGQFHHILPTAAQSVCRHIDRVIFGGHSGSQSSPYYDLYCADVESIEANRDRANSAGAAPNMGPQVRRGEVKSSSTRSGGTSRSGARRSARKPSAFGGSVSSGRLASRGSVTTAGSRGSIATAGRGHGGSDKSSKSSNVTPVEEDAAGLARPRSPSTEADIRQELHVLVSEEFRAKHSEAMKHYLSGDWQAALAGFAAAEALAPDGIDLPTRSVVKYIESFPDKAAPKGWGIAGPLVKGKVQWRAL